MSRNCQQREVFETLICARFNTFHTRDKVVAGIFVEHMNISALICRIDADGIYVQLQESPRFARGLSVADKT